MSRIPEQTISRIIETADIVEVISSRIELKKGVKLLGSLSIP